MKQRYLLVLINVIIIVGFIFHWFYGIGFTAYMSGLILGEMIGDIFGINDGLYVGIKGYVFSL